MNTQRFYGSNDMAKVGCHDCNGCSSCCQDMGQSIWLDPYDIYNLTKKYDYIIKTFYEIEKNDSFNLKHIFECGQCFRWKKEIDGSYTGVFKNNVLNVKEENNIIDTITVEKATKEESLFKSNYLLFGCLRHI